MARNRIKSTSQLLAAQQLRTFADFTEQHQRWQQLFAETLLELQLEALQAHLQVLNIRAHTLIVQASSAAVAQRLKSVQGRIITHFQARARLQIDGLELQIRPNSANAPISHKKATVDPADTVAQLRHQASLCEEPLRSQLLALADKYQAN